MKRGTSWHVGVAAEAIAAAQFARCGFDVSVQYGANQPEYDLIIARGESILKVSVKSSQDGGWGLAQSYLAKANLAAEHNRPNYQGAVELWLGRHGTRTVFCFVQFEGIALSGMPRMYLARPAEVAERLRATAKGRGDSTLFENHAWGPHAAGAGTVERIPDDWAFSLRRIEQLLTEG